MLFMKRKSGPGLISYGGSNCFLLLANIETKAEFDSAARVLNVAFSESKHAIFIVESLALVEILNPCRFQGFEAVYLSKRNLIRIGIIQYFRGKY